MLGMLRPTRVVSMLLPAVVGACTGGVSIPARLQQCGILGEGEIGPPIERLFYAPNDCYRACLSEASCEDLRSTLCGSSIDLLLRCDRRCAARCDDGSLIAVEALCDGTQHCVGGEDERDCPTFRCSDGTELLSRLRCDGWNHCLGGEDEQDCPGQLSCRGRSGEMLGPSFQCDGFEQCVDGSDERSCFTHRCDDGTELLRRPGRGVRCDEFRHCPDGSDEEGCAQLVLMCPSTSR